MVTFGTNTIHSASIVHNQVAPITHAPTACGHFRSKQLVVPAMDAKVKVANTVMMMQRESFIDGSRTLRMPHDKYNPHSNVTAL